MLTHDRTVVFGEDTKHSEKKIDIQKNDFEEVSLKNLFSYMKEFYSLRQ
jgi:hypothetical protein